MKGEEKKVWVKPELIVLVTKTKPEDAILQHCQESGSGSHMDGVDGDCFDYGSICVICAY
jgi:hypothetical protein